MLLAPLRSATCREPQGRAIGMMEQWNDGIMGSGLRLVEPTARREHIGMMGLKKKGIKTQYNCIDILVTLAYFLGQKQRMEFLTDYHHKGVDSTFFIE